MASSPHRYWRSRDFLPHWDLEEQPVTLTYRLEGSIPAAVLERWCEELASLPPAQQDRRLRERIERFLDAGYGPTWLRDPVIGRLKENAFLHHDGLRYMLHAWVVMPNHVHVLITPLQGHGIDKIIQSWKRHTALFANKHLRRSGTFWQRDYFDRTIRNERHFAAAVAYIENNPVKANLCSRPEEWPFSSARWRSVGEPDELRRK